jgi:hypothetical protein
MSSVTISLTDTATSERVVFIWWNISHFYKPQHQDGTRIQLMSSKYEIHVNESVVEVERAIEQAARND